MTLTVKVQIFFCLYNKSINLSSKFYYIIYYDILSVCFLFKMKIVHPSHCQLYHSDSGTSVFVPLKCFSVRSGKVDHLFQPESASLHPVFKFCPQSTTLTAV